MKKGTLIGLIIAILVILLIAGYFLALFYGTPWGKMNAEKRFNEYIEQNYNDPIKCEIYYFFKTGYNAECENEKTHKKFTLHIDENKNIYVWEDLR